MGRGGGRTEWRDNVITTWRWGGVFQRWRWCPNASEPMKKEWRHSMPSNLQEGGHRDENISQEKRERGPWRSGSFCKLVEAWKLVLFSAFFLCVLKLCNEGFVFYVCDWRYLVRRRRRLFVQNANRATCYLTCFKMSSALMPRSDTAESLRPMSLSEWPQW